MATRSILARRLLPALAGCILCTVVAAGSLALLHARWSPIAPAVADDGGGGHGGGSGSSGGSGSGSGGDSHGGSSGSGTSGSGSGSSGSGSSGSGGSGSGSSGSGSSGSGSSGSGSSGSGSSGSSGSGSSGSGSSGDGNGDGGRDNSGPGSASSGHGGGDDDSGEAEGGDDAPRVGGAAAPVAGTAPGRAERGGRDYVDGEVVVANMDDAARAALRRLGFVVLEERRFASLGFAITRLGVPRGMTPSLARGVIASRFPTLLADVNALYRPQGELALPAPDYPQRLIGWGHVPDDCGTAVRLGMVDTGVDQRLQALRAARITQRSFLSGDTPSAGLEHGTAIAAILVGQGAAGGSGLLPRAELSVASVFTRDGDGAPVAEVLALVDGLNWLVDRGVPVINLSFAGEANALVSLAVRRAAAAHAVLVAAAGNGGPDAPPAFPAAEAAVVGVTAVDSRMRAYEAANQGDYVDFAAPGVRVWTPTADGTGSYSSGTSFATPYVAAALAVRAAREPGLDPQREVTALAGAALDLGTRGKDPVFGWGLVQSANPCGTQTQ